MRVFILIGTVLLIWTDLLGQGGVNVLYTPVDYVDVRFVGKKVKIDFRGQRTKQNIIEKSRIADTVTLIVDNRQFTIIERKGTGADYWYFDKEALESIDYKPGHLLRIEDIELKNVQNDSILFRMTFNIYKVTISSGEPISVAKDVWVSKNIIEGILEKEK
jgi:hypothetical protein